MSHFCELNYPENKIAVITNYGKSLTYGELAYASDQISLFFPKKQKSLIVILCTNTYEALCGYLACLRSENVPLLLDAKVEKEFLKTILDSYHPDFLWAPEQSESALYSLGKYNLTSFNEKKRSFEINQELGLLLSTSGSTGSPKLVRLSKKNLQVNAESICEYLKIDENERAITVLPIQYTYGLSIINSHLNSGAVILMTDHSIMQSSFWDFAKENQVSSLSGVPYTYQMYKRLKLFDMDLPTLKTMTQAGGKLPADLGKEFSEFCNSKKIRFFIMYGQTEATARMSYLPPEKNLEKYTSIGIAVPGGSFSIIDDNGITITRPEMTGELVYEGDNVMMGYAENAFDLSKGYELNGRLVTGDMAKFDTDGFYYIVGRKKRFVKLFGNRINLDEIEQLLKVRGYHCACAGQDDNLTVYMTENGHEKDIKSYLAQVTHINASAFKVRVIAELPLSDSGKILYSKLDEVK